MNDNEIVQNDTCFAAHERFQQQCNKRTCKNWIDKSCSYNCVLLAAKKPMTLHEIGMIFGLTRMRICQIEKAAKAKITLMLKNVAY